MTRARMAGRRRARGRGRAGHWNSGRWFPWWRDSARGWRCCAPVPVPSACAARPGISAGKAPWRQRSSMPSRAAAPPAGWVSPTAFSPRASRPGPPGTPGQRPRRPPCPPYPRCPRHTRAQPRWWPPAAPGRSWPRSRSACWTAPAPRIWRPFSPGWASGRWESSPRWRPPMWSTGSGCRESSPTGWRAAWTPATGRPFGFGRIRPARPPGRARGVRRQGAGRADA
jgi:hypothetical protein